MSRPTIAEIDLSALRHNFRRIASRLPGGAGILAVVKANAYGHGALPVAAALSAEGARMFGVATVEEGIELREGGIRAPVVVLGGVDEPQADEALSCELSAALYGAWQIPPLAKAASRAGRPFPVHVKVDTGMGRLGFLPEEVAGLLSDLPGRRELRVDGWMTHLSSADGGDEASRSYTRRQLSDFAEDLPAVRRAFGGTVVVHALNSAGILTCADCVHDMVRPGILLYGCLPAEGLGAELGVRPVMRIVTKIASLKELPAGHPVSYGRRYVRDAPRRIAVVPVGYADGYRRDLSNRAAMTVRGCPAPVAGTVCMDHTMIDVTEIPGADVGDDVVVLGGAGASADALAAVCGTIPYEILTRVGRRIPRVVVG